MLRFFGLPSLFAALCLSICCVPKHAWTPDPPEPNDHAYLDLTAGSRLRILMPILPEGEDSTHLLGFQVSYYAVKGGPDGTVRLRFTSAEATRDGHTLPLPSAPRLPFPLPEKAQFVRLVFLVRESETDHNEAIVAAGRRADLDPLTERLKKSPDVCQVSKETFCVWVPQGIAVRPEAPSEFANCNLKDQKTCGTAEDNSHLQRPTPALLGKLVNVEGHKVHIYCTGQGSPVVVIAGGGFSFDWGLVQPKIAKLTKVCTYDTAGTAWSDPAPAQSDAACAARVDELRGVLNSAGIHTPPVLVGFSMGGLIARLFAAMYPDQIAGMVLVDHAFIDTGTSEATEAHPPTSLVGLDAPPILIFEKSIELDLEDDQNFSKLPERNQELHKWAVLVHSLRPKPETVAQCFSELGKVESRLPSPLGDKPVTVVSTLYASSRYRALQQRLLSLSRDSKQFIADHSSHMVIIDQPDTVVEAIESVVNALRNGAPVGR